MTITLPKPTGFFTKIYMRPVEPRPAPLRPDGLTAETARALLERAVKERGPGYVYAVPPFEEGKPRCRYQTNNGKPDCLIGLALSYIGPIPENAMGVASNAVATLYPTTSPRVLRAMDAAQSAQDNGETWGDALKAFDLVINDKGIFL